MVDPRDQTPQGEPETVVVLPEGSLVGLSIKGVRAPTMLGIREDAAGQPVSCAITNELAIDTAGGQSNPRRAVDPEDGA